MTKSFDTALDDNAVDVKTAYESNADTNALTDAFKGYLDQLSLTSSIIAISSNAVTNSKTGAIAIGDGAETDGLPNASAGELPEHMISIGTGATSYNRASIALGYGAQAGSPYTGSPAIHDMGAIAIGFDATASSRFSVVIGRLANDQGALNATVIGDQAGSSKGTGQKCVIIGNDGGAGERGVAIGDTVDAGSHGIVIGSALATSNGTQYGQAYGAAATCSHDYSIAFGKGATTTADSQMMIGGTTGSDVLDVVVTGDLTVNGTSNITANISVEDEGTEVVAADTINFVGSGVTVTNVGGVPTVTIASGGAPVDSVNGQTGVVVLDADDIDDTATTNKFTTAGDISKLAGIEASADVTDTANVTSAGAFMTATNDSDDITEGTTNLFFTSAEQTKLSGIETGADVTDTANVTSAGAFMTASDTLDDITAGTTNKHFTATDETKLDGIATSATANPDAVDSTTTGVTGADAITNMMSLTQAEYDAITPNASTLYFITDAT